MKKSKLENPTNVDNLKKKFLEIEEELETEACSNLKGKIVDLKEMLKGISDVELQQAKSNVKKSFEVQDKSQSMLMIAFD